jgi:hypothetical protein
VSDIAKGVLSGAWGLLVGWILPSALALAVFGLFVLPNYEDVGLVGNLARAANGTKSIALLVAAAVLGLVLSAAQTPLYRVLEGYLGWPERLVAIRKRSHVRRRDTLGGKIDKELSGSTNGRLSNRGTLVLEAYLRYPASTDQVAPTMLGNSIRRFEYYAQDRYGMDSQLLWYQLRSVVPEGLRTDVNNARTGVDFFVCMCYMSGLLALAAVVGMITGSGSLIGPVLVATAGVVVSIGCYRASIMATDVWAAAVRAMVDLGRVPLARSVGLNLPESLEEERAMWQDLGWLTAFPYRQEVAKQIDRWRTSTVGSSGKEKSSPM